MYIPEAIVCESLVECVCSKQLRQTNEEKENQKQEKDKQEWRYSSVVEQVNGDH